MSCRRIRIGTYLLPELKRQDEYTIQPRVRYEAVYLYLLPYLFLSACFHCWWRIIWWWLLWRWSSSSIWSLISASHRLTAWVQWIMTLVAVVHTCGFTLTKPCLCWFVTPPFAVLCNIFGNMFFRNVNINNYAACAPVLYAIIMVTVVRAVLSGWLTEQGFDFWAFYLLSASVSLVFMMLYISTFLVTFCTVPFNELSLEGLALDLVD